MNRRIQALACAAALSLPFSAAASSHAGNHDELARRLVRNAAVAEGEVVLISGQVHDAGLMEDIAVAVRGVGAFPLVEYSSDRLSKRLFFDVPAKYDSQQNTLGMKLAELVDVTFQVAGSMNESLMAGADPARIAARGKAGEPVAEAFLKHNVRSVEIGNGFYPTDWRAARYGMSRDELAKVFWVSVGTDTAGLQSRAEALRAVLAAGDLLHITNPNGTDLKVSIKGRKSLASDGVISPDELKAGAPATNIYLPAGEVYLSPVDGTAEGVVVHSRDYFRGKEIQDLRLEFRAGKLVSMSGSGPGYADFRAAYDAVADERKNSFSFVDFGINTDLRLPAASKVGAWVPAGTVSVGTGANSWAGGDNMAPFGMTAFLPGSTVTLDGKEIVKAGELKL